ncbi:unnamed protein product [Rhizophagus irregularis]|nr:unnamed protein product [Rhizophagus irregularis]
MEEELSEDTHNSEFTHDNCNDKAILSNEDEHIVYKKALNKTLRFNSKSEQLISLLQEFTEDGESDLDELNEIDQDEITDKENIDPSVPVLRNPKKQCGKGRPLGTKRFKSSTEASKPKSRNQRHCRKCGKVGHYQKNCKKKKYNEQLVRDT